MSFSQNTSTIINQDTTISITNDQLKFANLIFIEHEKLISENQLLLTQINNYQSKINTLEEINSLHLNQIDKYELLNQNYLDKINELNKINIKKDKTIKWITIGGVSISCSLLILLLLK